MSSLEVQQLLYLISVDSGQRPTTEKIFEPEERSPAKYCSR